MGQNFEQIKSSCMNKQWITDWYLDKSFKHQHLSPPPRSQSYASNLITAHPIEPKQKHNFCQTQLLPISHITRLCPKRANGINHQQLTLNIQSFK